MVWLKYVIIGCLVSILCSFLTGLFPLLKNLLAQKLNAINMNWVHSWNIIFSAVLCISETVQSTSSGELKKTIGSFWHLTDLHVDREYSRTGNPNDMCHGSNKNKLGDNGLYGNFLCDAPWSLVDLTIDAMQKIEPEPDFIIWTGDNLPHTRNPHPGWDVTFRELRNITDLLQQTFPGIPIYPCIGNHDTFPPNILQPDYSANDSIYDSYLKKGSWKNLLPDSALDTFRHGGFYSAIIKKGLRLISLNTIVWYAPNKVVKHSLDPSGQFDWLAEQLKSAEAADEKVYIIGHVPPGFYNRVYPGETGYQTYHPQFLESFMSVIKKYYHVISGQFFAHLHNDMFQIYHYDSGQALSSGLMASSVTPWYSNTSKNVNVSIPVNPSVRLVQFKKGNWTPLNYLQYYLNLTKANEQAMQGNHAAPEYELLYSFIETYNVPDLSSESLVIVFEKLKSSPALFQKFYDYLTSGKKSVPCDSHCESAQLCSMSCTSKEHYLMCMKKMSSLLESGANLTAATNSGSNVLQSGTLTYSLVIGFACLVALVLAAFFVFYCKRSRPYPKPNYIHLSSL